MTAKQAAEACGLDYPTFIRACKAGLGPRLSQRVGTARLFAPDDVAAWNVARLERIDAEEAGTHTSGTGATAEAA